MPLQVINKSPRHEIVTGLPVPQFIIISYFNHFFFHIDDVLTIKKGLRNLAKALKSSKNPQNVPTMSLQNLSQLCETVIFLFQPLYKACIPQTDTSCKTHSDSDTSVNPFHQYIYIEDNQLLPC